MNSKLHLPFGVSAKAPDATEYRASKIQESMDALDTHKLLNLAYFTIFEKNVVYDLVKENLSKMRRVDDTYNRMRQFLRRPYHPMQIFDVSNNSSSLYTGYAWFVFYSSQLRRFGVYMDPRAIQDKKVLEFLYKKNATQDDYLAAAKLLFTKSKYVILVNVASRVHITYPFRDFGTDKKIPMIEEPMYGYDILGHENLSANMIYADDELGISTGIIRPYDLYLLFRFRDKDKYFVYPYDPDKHCKFVGMEYGDLLGRREVK